MDAFAWHALAGGHKAIHRGQIERILWGIRTLKVPNPREQVQCCFRP